MKLKSSDDGELGASFRDPSGYLFWKDGVLYRQINQLYQPHYDHLLTSGLYKNLVEAGLLIPHEESDLALADSDDAYKVIRPESIPFISYPYEWSFSQLKNAALATLKIQKRALKYGMWLKDSSAYNIQFHKGRPVLIDTLSFETYNEGQPWVAYRQFCQNFLAPLSLMAYRDVRLNQLMRVYIDGVPLDLASELLPLRTRLVIPLLLHIHLHASSQRRYADKPVNISTRVSKISLLGLIDSLESGVKKARWKPEGTEWGHYYDQHNYTAAGLKHKEEVVAGFFDKIQPKNVWDLGANDGKFSRLASERAIPTVAFDVDPAAVEQNYLDCISRKEIYLLPILADLTNPSPAIGWQNQERMSMFERGPVDAVLALALIHHLAISNNVPLPRVARFFQQLGRWLIIEFVPKEDSQVQKLLLTREDIFSEYNQEQFERIFQHFFIIHDTQPVFESKRCIYLMENRGLENIEE
jgi:hypothetical protein